MFAAAIGKLNSPEHDRASWDHIMTAIVHKFWNVRQKSSDCPSYVHGVVKALSISFSSLIRLRCELNRWVTSWDIYHLPFTITTFTLQTNERQVAITLLRSSNVMKTLGYLLQKWMHHHFSVRWARVVQKHYTHWGIFQWNCAADCATNKTCLCLAFSLNRQY